MSEQEAKVQACRDKLVADRKVWEEVVKMHLADEEVTWFGDNDYLNCQISSGLVFTEDGTVTRKPNLAC